VPRAGNQLYIAIRGKDAAGNPFYVKTGRVEVNTENGYDDVTVIYSFSNSKAIIGHPFTVNYEIKGGSGEYEEIYYRMDEVTEQCGINDYFQEGELTESVGMFTVVPECGESIDINVSCIDKITGISWNENYSIDILCEPNPDVKATINYTPSKVLLNEPLFINYEVDGINEINEVRVEVWAFIKNETYPDLMFDQLFSSSTDVISYTPKAGNQLYIAIRGKDKDGRPFYVKTGRIDITGQSTLTNCLILPASIQRIEAESFSYVNATMVYIPACVEYIDKNAFTDSNITTILGNSSLIAEYAQENGFIYMQYTLSE